MSLDAGEKLIRKPKMHVQNSAESEKYTWQNYRNTLGGRIRALGISDVGS